MNEDIFAINFCCFPQVGGHRQNLDNVWSESKGGHITGVALRTDPTGYGRLE